MTDQHFLLFASAIVWSYLFIHGVCTLNLMNRKTHLLQRLGYICFTMGAFTLLIGPYFGLHRPCWAEVGFGAGLVLFHSKHAYYVWRKGYRKFLHDVREFWAA